MPWYSEIGRHRSAYGDGLRRLSDGPVRQKRATPEAMSDKRLMRLLCSRKADCASCECPCAYGREWLRRKGEREVDGHGGG